MSRYELLLLRFMRKILIIFSFLTSSSVGLCSMPHKFEKTFPPFEIDGDKDVIDKAISIECDREVEALKDDHEGISILKMRVSHNENFGSVCRVDFSTLNDLDGQVNRMMIWRGVGKKYSKFVGLNIPAKLID